MGTIGGWVVKLMVGARWEHGRIVQRIARLLENGFEAAGSRCQIVAETFYVKRVKLNAMLLPNVVVVCRDLEAGATSTDEPAVIFEVLSTGTEARDRLEKWYDYQRLLSLQHYVLVARSKPRVEVFDQVAGTWSGMRVLDGLEAVLDLPTIGAGLPLAGIYRRVPDL